MARYEIEQLHKDAVGLRLHKIDANDKLTACEAVFFKNGREGVDTVLRRAQLAGRVEVEGVLTNHFADVLIDEHGSWDQTIMLDAASYKSLKNKWMRCKIESRD